MVSTVLTRHSTNVAWALLGVSLLAGCASGGGDPGARSLPTGETCQSVRGQLNKLDSKGVPALVEAQSAGRKLAPAQKADADAYNRLLNSYLGARCHVI